MKKIVIAGGGVSGLTAGIYAQKAGYQAVICEKNAVPGGECTGWDREGYHIDNCIHWMMGTSGKSALHDIWKETGALGTRPVHHMDAMYTSRLRGEAITLWKDVGRTQRELLTLSPEDAREIGRLIAGVRLARNITIPADMPGELMRPFDLLKLAASSANALRVFRRYAGMDTADLAARFRHPLIRAVLTDFCPKESMASAFPMAYGNFVGGDGGIPAGGSRAMAERMRVRFTQLGGRWRPNAEAEKLCLQGERAISLLLKSGEQVEGDYFILACDPDVTFSRLLGPQYMDAVFREVYAQRAAYPVYGMFQAAYAVESACDAVGGDVILDCGELVDEVWISGRMSVKSYAYEPSFSPTGRQLVQVLWGLTEDAYDVWTALYEKDRAAYHVRKAALAARAQAKIEENFPAWRGKLRLLDSWTPVTYRRFCNAYKGYNQAFTVTKHSRKDPYPSPYITGVKNAVLAGQWLSPPGGLPGAAIQGKFSVQRIIHLARGEG